MLLDIFQNFLVNTFSLIFVKDKGNITAIHHEAKVFGNKGRRHAKSFA